MLIELVCVNDVSEEGLVRGGTVRGVGLSIDWQDHPLDPAIGEQPTGAFVEAVIIAAIRRLECYQETKFACRENALAITKLEEALHWQEARTRDRVRRGVEGTNQV